MPRKRGNPVFSRLASHYFLFILFGFFFFTFFALRYTGEQKEIVNYYFTAWIASTVITFGLKLSTPAISRGNAVGAPDFDEPITPATFVLAASTAMACVGLAALASKAAASQAMRLLGALYVPFEVAVPTWIGNAAVQFIWQTFVVAWTEESIVYILTILGSTLVYIAAGGALRRMGGDARGHLLYWSGAVIARLSWAVFHTQRNPAYMGQPALILIAFAVGLALSALLKYTGSLPAVAVAHSLINLISQGLAGA